MKTATIPSLRVEPELRHAAESVLEEGESLSSLMEQSLRDQIRRRRTRQAFLQRGLAARDQARAADEYYPAQDVVAELDAMLAARKSRAAD